MYCSIDEAWNNKNTIDHLSKRYQENFNPNPENELDSYKINNNTLSTTPETPIFIQRQHARYNKAPQTIYNDMLNESEDIQTEDIMLSTEEPTQTKPKKSSFKNKEDECKKLVDKVLSCATCRKLIETKLKINKNPFNNLINGEIREILILILIGLIIMIIIDLFIRISK